MSSPNTRDTMLAGRMTVLQPRHGYRFNLDSILLAHFAEIKKRATVLDLGCGTGVVAFLLMARFGAAISRLDGLDLDPTVVDLARQNLQANSWIKTPHVEFHLGDWQNGKALAKDLPVYDTVVSNPPWFRVGAGRVSPNADRQRARQFETSLKHWAGFVRRVLKNKGSVFAVYSAPLLNPFLQVLAGAGLEPKVLRFVHDRCDREAKSVLIKAVAQGRAGCQIAAPLFVRQANGAYTDAVKSMLEGR